MTRLAGGPQSFPRASLPHSCQSRSLVYIYIYCIYIYVYIYIAIAEWGAHVAAVIYCRYLRMAPSAQDIRSVTRNSSVFSLSGWISAKMHVDPLLRMLGTSSIRCKRHEYRHHAEGAHDRDHAEEAHDIIVCGRWVTWDRNAGHTTGSCQWDT